MLVQGDSMKPTIKDKALVVVDKRSDIYQVDDIIAFTCDGIKGVLVKRVVAVAGDKVQIKDGILYVNDRPSSCQLKDKPINYAGLASEELVVPDGKLFVIGDNYNESKDSRYEEIGLIDKEDVIGRVME